MAPPHPSGAIIGKLVIGAGGHGISALACAVARAIIRVVLSRNRIGQQPAVIVIDVGAGAIGGPNSSCHTSVAWTLDHELDHISLQILVQLFM